MSFASFPIETLDLPKNFREAALKANLTTSAILLSPIPKLTELLKCKIPFAQDLVKAVSQALAPEPVTLDVLFDEDYGRGECEKGTGEEMVGKGKGKWISTGDEGLDECLGGGLRRGCLYEIAGESAAGKSHFALTLALCCQLSSLTSSPGGSLILTSERELSTDRLIQLAESLLATNEPWVGEHHEGEIDPRVKGLLDNVLSNRVGDIDALEHALSYAIPALLESRLKASSSSSSPSSQPFPSRTYIKPIRLIILDSLTALLRGGSASSPATRPAATSSSFLTERSKHLCVVADLLKALAVTYDVAVVVINQVSDVFPRHVPASSFGSPPAAAGTPPSSAWDQTQPFGPGMAQHQASSGKGNGGDPPMLYASQSRWFSGQSDVLNKEASLGIVWANAVNVRIMLSRTGRRRMLDQNDLRPVKRRRPRDQDEDEDQNQDEEAEAKPTLIRRMHVVFTPFCPSGTVDYAITPSGIHSLPGSYEPVNILENMRKVWGNGKGTQTASVMMGTGDIGMGWGGIEKKGVGAVVGGSGLHGDVFDDYGELPAEYWDVVIAGETMAVEPPVMEETDERVVSEADAVEEMGHNVSHETEQEGLSKEK
ncbi:uncharacterized protein IAS62_004960 [Cryptococcus decagattii]|uniref:RecA family profile 1 domain-containing protein n=1 Tax=Cryptococcus decagattii TaxID=1859122 RepID=A0ABZ2AYH8_9TREE